MGGALNDWSPVKSGEVEWGQFVNVLVDYNTRLIWIFKKEFADSLKEN